MRKFSLVLTQKILIGYIIITFMFSFGLLISFNSAQVVINNDREIFDRYEAIQRDVLKVGILLDQETNNMNAYTVGLINGQKEEFSSKEVQLSAQVEELTTLLQKDGTKLTGFSILNEITLLRPQWKNAVIFKVMSLPNQAILSNLQLKSLSIEEHEAQSVSLLLKYKATGNTSFRDTFDNERLQVTKSITELNDTIDLIRPINSTVAKDTCPVIACTSYIYEDFAEHFDQFLTQYQINSASLTQARNEGNSTTIESWLVNASEALDVNMHLTMISSLTVAYTDLLNTYVNEANQKLIPIRIKLAELQHITDQEIQKAKTRSSNEANFSFWISSGILLTGLLSSVFIGLFISRGIARPVKNLSSKTKQIANGNLEVDLDFQEKEKGDEVYELTKSFKIMIEFLIPIINEVNKVVSSLTTAAQEMASSSEEVNASSEEISSITQQMSKGAQDQSLQINETTRSAQDLRSVFEEKVQEIQKATKLIEQINSQVNMLALNASIEAARAGEYGRGFSVVADNIRNLADDSKKALSTIYATISSLENSLTLSIDGISESIEKVASIAEETASGAEEASAATEEQAATMEELTASAQDLSNMATSLDQLVLQFRQENKNKL